MFRQTISDQAMVAASQKLREKEYWLKKLSNAPGKSYLYYDFHQGRSLKNRGTAKGLNKHKYQAVTFTIEGNCCERLIKLSNGADFRVHMILTAALLVLINYYTGNKDIITGTPIYKQDVEIEFINTVLPLRNLLEDNMTFKELLLQVKDTMAGAIENQNYPIDVLAVDLNPTYEGDDFPLFDMALLLKNIHCKNYIREIYYNLLFSFNRTGECLQGIVEYNTLLYERSTIGRIIGHYKQLLMEALSNPGTRVVDIKLLSEGDKKQLLYYFNDNPPTYRENKRVHELFEKQAAASPLHTALVFKESQLTYCELNAKANQLALLLRARGVDRDCCAAIVVEPSLEMIIGIIAILKAGGAYLPIDPDFPLNRVRYMLEDSKVEILLTTGDLTSRLEPGENNIYLDHKQIYQGKISNLENINLPGDLAYIIYTSGTTGKPKGVMVEHGNVTAYVQAFFHEFNLSSEDTIILQSSYVFDAFVEELFPILIKGGKAAIPQKYEGIDMLMLTGFIIKHRINIIDCAPMLIREIDKLKPVKSLHTVISGGDILKHDYINNLLKTVKVYNTYGPTETTVCAAYYRCSGKMNGNIPIGKPVSNYRIYILGHNNRLLPVGVPGELCISGSGVTRGYLNRPDLTAEKFYHDFRDYPDDRDGKNVTYNLKQNPGRRIDNSHSSLVIRTSSRANDRLYRTGDLARWLGDGNIEFIGRIDSQVKIRGYRVELGEIECKLLGYEAVKKAAVVEKDEKGDTYLCAYVVPNAPGTALNVSVLRDYLAEELPDFMIPSFFLQVEQIPLTPGGKIDRKLLPEVKPLVGSPYVPPRDKTEQELVKIWSEVLNVPEDMIGIETSFFDLGGHSLKAVVLISRLHQTFNVHLPLAEIFRMQTIKALSEYIPLASSHEFVSIEAAEKKEYYPLAPAQRRLYILQQMEKNNIAYNIPQMRLVSSRLGRKKLEEAFKKLIQRHEILRTSFKPIPTNLSGVKTFHFMQKVHSCVTFEIEYHEVQDTGEKVNVKTPNHLARCFIRPFDLSRAPLLRAALIKTNNKENLLLVDMHHIISDEISHNIMTRDFNVLLEGRALPLLKLQYKDFSQWQNRLFETGKMKSQETYWLKQFEGEIPVLQLPLDCPRPAKQGFEGTIKSFTIGTRETRGLIQLASEERMTLYMVLLALYNMLLSKICNQEDIIVGTPVSGRRHVDLDQVIGMFVNTLALRNKPEGKKIVKNFLKDVKKNTLAAFENWDYPFENLVEQVMVTRDSSRNPIFDVMFAFQEFDRDPQANTDIDMDINAPLNSEFPGNGTSRVSKFDMTWRGAVVKENIFFIVEYSTKLFKSETIDKFIVYFKRLISAVIETPGKRIAEIGIISRTRQEEKLSTLYDDLENE